MIRFVTVEGHVEEDVLFGTCDLCEYMGSHHYNVWVFEDTNTLKSYEFENGSWSWGDYLETYHIENMIDFILWFNQQEYVMNWDELKSCMGDIVFEYNLEFKTDEWE